MSIIHDALKKVQQSMQQKPSVGQPLEQQTSPVGPVAKLPVDPMAQNPWTIPSPSVEKVETLPSAMVKKSNFTIPKPLLIISLLVMAVSFYFIYSQVQQKYPRLLPKLHLSFKSPTTHVVSKPAVVVSTPVPVTVIKDIAPMASPAPLPTAPPSPFSLQGIMASGNHNVALINNSVYEEGNLIEGRKILKITLNAVTLEYNGKQEELTLKK
jgi:type II secretory pathway component PulC